MAVRADLRPYALAGTLTLEIRWYTIMEIDWYTIVEIGWYTRQEIRQQLCHTLGSMWKGGPPSPLITPRNW